MTKYPTLIAKPQKLHTWALIQSMMGSLLAFQESIGIASLTLGISHVEVSGHIWISLSWFEYHSTGEIHHQLRCAILAQGFPLHISPGVVTKRLTQKKTQDPPKTIQNPTHSFRFKHHHFWIFQSVILLFRVFKAGIPWPCHHAHLDLNTVDG